MRFLSRIVFASLVVVPLSAQEPPPQTPPEEPFLEEMTVTATKRVEDVQDVPVAVTAVPDEQVQILTAGGADVKAISGRVPSLLIESSFGRAFPRFYIRGLGNTDFDLNASQPVSMVYDDVFLENPILKGMPVWDVDRIEVLRGPQGTLFGRNTPAGIVKFESKQPAQDFDGYVRGSIGTFNTIDLKGAVGGGLTGQEGKVRGYGNREQEHGEHHDEARQHGPQQRAPALHVPEEDERGARPGERPGPPGARRPTCARPSTPSKPSTYHASASTATRPGATSYSTRPPSSSCSSWSPSASSPAVRTSVAISAGL